MRPGLALAIAVLAPVLVPSIARADDPVDRATDPADNEPPPPAHHWHGSLAIGGSLLTTGDLGDTTRFDATLSFQPGRRFGAVLGARAFDNDPRSMMLTGGVEFQAAASRPRLVLTLYADAGIETRNHDPVLGVGTRTTLVVFGPLGIVADTGFHLVISGSGAMDETRLVIATALMIAVAR